MQMQKEGETQRTKRTMSSATTTGGGGGALRCPRRAFGSASSSSSNGDPPKSSSRLASSVPIIGFGCSSFSAFFSTTSKISDQETDPQQPKLTIDNATKDHPQIRHWIAAIKHGVVDCGITLLDTAPWYGHGLSEIVVGFALEDILNDASNNVSRSDLVVNTKVGRYDLEPSAQFDFSYDRTLSSVQLSLERLKCGYIDVLQLHDPEFTPSLQLLLDETIPALIVARDEKKWAKALGLTGYPLEVQRDILVRSQTTDGFVFDQSLTYCHCNLHDVSLFIAPPSSLGPLTDFEPPSSVSLTSETDRTLLTSNVQEASTKSLSSADAKPTASGVVAENEEDSDRNVYPSTAPWNEPVSSFAEFCQTNNIALMAAAPLSMGLLTQAGPPSWHPASPELRAACRNAAYICEEEYGVNFASLAILFALAQAEIPCTLLGLKSVEEMDRAMELAKRFDGLDEGLSTEEILDTILTQDEKDCLVAVMDNEYGPLAECWETGAFQWDGLAIADEHWDKVEGGKEAAEKKMRIRN